MKEDTRYVTGYVMKNGSMSIYPINPGAENPYEVETFDKAFEVAMKMNEKISIGWCVYRIENSLVPVVALRRFVTTKKKESSLPNL